MVGMQDLGVASVKLHSGNGGLLGMPPIERSDFRCIFAVIREILAEKGSQQTASTANWKTARVTAFALVLVLAQALSSAYAQRSFPPEVEAFIGEMVQKHQFDPAALRKVLARAQPQPSIVRAISA